MRKFKRTVEHYFNTLRALRCKKSARLNVPQEKGADLSRPLSLAAGRDGIRT